MKQKLQPFQQATVEQVIEALSKKSGRFLIADEVGLGKTVVAKAIIEELAERSRRRKKAFCVYYFANNLALLGQNRRRFESSSASLNDPVRNGDPLYLDYKSEKRRLQIDCYPEDRLALGWSWASKADVQLAIFTPSTSLPDLHIRSYSTGRRSERTLSAAFFRLATGAVLDVRVRRYLAGTAIGGKGKASDRRKLRKFDSEARRDLRILLKGGMPRRMLANAFVSSLFSVLKIAGPPNARRLREELKNQVAARRNLSSKELNERLAKIRKALRIALCEAAIKRGHLKPDLIILDEFHRYYGILNADSSSLGGRLLGQSRVLLLSATPFEFKAEDGGTQPLVHLAKFLYRGRDDDDLRGALEAYKKRLLDDVPTDDKQRASWRNGVLKQKRRIEKSLRQVVERTERWDDQKLVNAKLIQTSHDIRSNDLEIFDDFAERLRRAASRRRPINAVSHCTPLWMSVPYPVQTLPFGYVASRGLAFADGGHLRSSIGKLKPRVGAPTQLREALDHPKLRALLTEPSQRRSLALPWIAPSLPWWDLSSVWADSHLDSSKSLVFCHYRASPPAIGGLISREFERTEGPSHLGWRDISRKPRFAVGGSGPSKDLLALFFPWQSLAGEFEPLKVLRRSKADALSAAAQFLKSQDLTSIEALCHREPRSNSRNGSKKDGFADLFGRARGHSQSDIQYLSRLTLAGPGVILLRTFRRHYRSQIDAEAERDIASISWKYLRPYLGQRYFDRALGSQGRRSRSPRRHAMSERRALLDAIIDGNLESVLDEHLTIWRQLNANRDSPGNALEDLQKALDFKVGSLSLHERRQNKRVVAGRLRAHVAVAFSGQEASGEDGSSSEPRPETLRIAFNSPFWPHMLVTTSVGQEGLDFHVWCRRVVHWDVPPNPIALEQREGRITRYGSLAVRRALASDSTINADILATAVRSRFISPWLLLKNRAESAYANSAEKIVSGLSPWWVVPDGHHERLVLSPPFSHEHNRFQKMLEDLDLYRLAMGQPDPEKFVERLRGQITADDLRRLAIDLSGARLRSNSIGR